VEKVGLGRGVPHYTKFVNQFPDDGIMHPINASRPSSNPTLPRLMSRDSVYTHAFRSYPTMEQAFLRSTLPVPQTSVISLTYQLTALLQREY
jgi:hypothetical protein